MFCEPPCFCFGRGTARSTVRSSRGKEGMRCVFVEGREGGNDDEHCGGW